MLAWLPAHSPTPGKSLLPSVGLSFLTYKMGSQGRSSGSQPRLQLGSPAPELHHLLTRGLEQAATLGCSWCSHSTPASR